MLLGILILAILAGCSSGASSQGSAPKVDRGPIPVSSIAGGLTSLESGDPALTYGYLVMNSGRLRLCPKNDTDEMSRVEQQCLLIEREGVFGGSESVLLQEFQGQNVVLEGVLEADSESLMIGNAEFVDAYPSENVYGDAFAVRVNATVVSATSSAEVSVHGAWTDVDPVVRGNTTGVDLGLSVDGRPVIAETDFAARSVRGGRGGQITIRPFDCDGSGGISCGSAGVVIDTEEARQGLYTFTVPLKWTSGRRRVEVDARVEVNLDLVQGRRRPRVQPSSG